MITEAVLGHRDGTSDGSCHKTRLRKEKPPRNKTAKALGLTTLKGGPQFGLGMAINDGDGLW
jgi:hypothetical protein